MKLKMVKNATFLLLILIFFPPPSTYGHGHRYDWENEDLTLMEAEFMELDQERNPGKSPDFEYLSINTSVGKGYESLPRKSDAVSNVAKRGKLFMENEPCEVSLTIELLSYEKKVGTMCLYQDVVDSQIVSSVIYSFLNTKSLKFGFVLHFSHYFTDCNNSNWWS